jgi:SulP family sulfate permease
MQLSSIRRDWFANPMREMLAGAVATFALIPEVIAFSLVAGVDPQVGLFASFVIAIVIAFTGGRPAMISAAAGSVALVAAPLVHAHGLPYLFAAGLFQVVFGLLRLGVLMRFVSKSVRTGFDNALAILIFAAQLPHIFGGDWSAYGMLASELAIIY